MLELPRKLRVNNSMMCVLNINLKRVKREETFFIWKEILVSNGW